MHASVERKLIIILLMVIKSFHASDNDSAVDDSELEFCTNLPDNCLCDFGDDSLLKLYIYDQMPKSIVNHTQKYRISIKELFLNRIHDVQIPKIDSLEALRIINSNNIDLSQDVFDNLQTLEILNSTFVSGEPFKFIQKQRTLKTIHLSGLEMNDQQLIRTFGSDECSSNVIDLRLNAQCQNVQFTGSLSIHNKMFQNLCKIKFFDISCTPLALDFNKTQAKMMFSNFTLPNVILY